MINYIAVSALFILFFFTVFRFLKADVIVNTVTNKILVNLYIYNNFLIFKFKLNLSQKINIQINNKMQSEEKEKDNGKAKEKKNKKAAGNFKYLPVIINSIDFKHAEVNIKYGTSESMLTSQEFFFLKLTILNFLAYLKMNNKIKDYNVNMVPVFNNAQLNLSFSLRLRLHPFELIGKWLHILNQNRIKEKSEKVVYE